MVAENSATCRCGRRLFEDAFDGIDEAHAQHFVGLVQHQQRQSRELQGAAVHVIDDASRRSNDHVHAAPQGVELRLVALAAVDRQHVKPLQMRGILQERLGHLQGEFAGGHQHQHLRFMLGQIDARQRRQGEGGGLAGAGLRLAQHVGPGQQHGNRRGLDGRGRLVAHVGQAHAARARTAQDRGSSSQPGLSSAGTALMGIALGEVAASLAV